MDAKILLVILFTLGLVLVVDSQLPSLPTDFSCSLFEPNQTLNLEEISGYWYEAARIPNSDVMQCLNVSVPETADENLNLDVKYLTIFRNREAVNEIISFPWDENTQRSIFILDYNLTQVIYKIMYTNENFTFLCGYPTIYPIPLFKVFTRQREVNPTYKLVIESLLERYGIAQYVTWTEQSPEQCHANAATRPKAAVSWAIIALTVLWNSFKTNNRN